MKTWVKWFIGIVIGVILLVGILYLLKLMDGPATFSPDKIDDSTKNQIQNLFANRTIIGKDGGACLFNEGDIAYDPICILTTNEDCLKKPEPNSLQSASFHAGLLCTAEELETECAPVNQSMSISGEKYFFDSCGNQANPYDSSQFRNKTYWTYLV